ncbi:MAG: PA2169 family four-helix-bundle protein [Planctomycetaceae bacterium]
MALETKLDLNPETIEHIQDLICINIDAYDGLKESAELIADQRVATVFRELAQERSQIAKELQTYCEWNGEQARQEGSIAAAVHRAWINIRGMVSDGDAYAILAEAERGEDQIKHAYEKALKNSAGSAMTDVLQAQYRKVKAGHDRIRDLRDHYKAMK